MTATLRVKTGQEPNQFTRYLPILSWLPGYDRSWLSFDIIAGLTLWGLVVPRSHGLRRASPVCRLKRGLYTLVASLLIYALLGTARHLSRAGLPRPQRRCWRLRWQRRWLPLRQ